MKMDTNNENIFGTVIINIMITYNTKSGAKKKKKDQLLSDYFCHKEAQ